MSKRNTQGKPPRPVSEPAAHVDDKASGPAAAGLGGPDTNTPRGSSGTAREASSADSGMATDGSAIGAQPGSPNPFTDASQGAHEGGAGNPAGPTAEVGTSAEWIAVFDQGKDVAAKTYPRLVAAFEAAEPPFNALRIKAKAERGFRRAGIFHPAEAVEHGLDTLTPAQVELLLGEPMLKVELV